MSRNWWHHAGTNWHAMKKSIQYSSEDLEIFSFVPPPACSNLCRVLCWHGAGCSGIRISSPGETRRALRPRVATEELKINGWFFGSVISKWWAIIYQHILESYTNNQVYMLESNLYRYLTQYASSSLGMLQLFGFFWGPPSWPQWPKQREHVSSWLESGKRFLWSVPAIAREKTGSGSLTPIQMKWSYALRPSSITMKPFWWCWKFMVWRASQWITWLPRFGPGFSF